MALHNRTFPIIEQIIVYAEANLSAMLSDKWVYGYSFQSGMRTSNERRASHLRVLFRWAVMHLSLMRKPPWRSGSLLEGRLDP